MSARALARRVHTTAAVRLRVPRKIRPIDWDATVTFLEPHQHALVSAAPLRNAYLQEVVGDHQRAVLERQARTNGSVLVLTESSREIRTDLSYASAALAHRRSRHFAVHGRGLGAGPIRVREDVQV